jgi:hypothetical protein
MSVDLLGAAVDTVGRVIFSPEPNARKIFFNLVFATPDGAEFVKLSSPAAMARLAEVLEAKFLSKNRNILVDDAAKVIRDLIATRDPALFPPEPEAEEVVDTRERDAAGRFKSEFQIFSETHSSADCANRAKVDSAYREWRQSQYRAEGLQEGAYRFAGAPLVEGTVENPVRRFASSVVADFAKVYRSVPSQRLRARDGQIRLDETHVYSPEDFELLVSQAVADGHRLL